MSDRELDGLVEQLKQKHPQDAIKFQAALTDAVHPDQAAVQLGIACFQSNEPETAVQLLLDTLYAGTHTGSQTQACEILGRYYERSEIYFDKALDTYRRGIEIAPDSRKLIALYNSALERSGEFELALSNLRKAQSAFPEDARLYLISAKCEKRKKRFDAALEDLKLALKHAQDCHHETGDTVPACELLDKKQAYSEAFRVISDINGQILKHGTNQHIAAQYLNSAKHNAAYLSARDKLSWKAADSEQRVPVFMIGFPRTGSTLLDQILSTHPDFYTVEERPTIETLVRSVFSAKQLVEYPACLSELTSEQLSTLQNTYWNILDKHIPDSQKNLKIIDKMPMNTAHIGLLNRMFPTARVIYTTRHPLDVCLSCFMQNFRDNAAMLNFLSIESTAELYSAVAEIWRESNRLLEIPSHTVRYEDVVTDFKTTIKGLLNFLGSNWHDDVTNYHRQAEQKGIIRTPSYQAVGEPLYDNAIHRWQRYRDELTQITPILAKHIELQGYSM